MMCIYWTVEICCYDNSIVKAFSKETVAEMLRYFEMPINCKFNRLHYLVMTTIILHRYTE